MIEIGQVNENNVLTVHASGKLTGQDYDRILPQMERLLQQHGKLRFYMDLDGLSAIEPDALRKDLDFDVEHRGQYGKTAVVGDSEWENWMTKFSNLFFDAEMKFFDKDQADTAWKWVNS